jgi:hypothetical protein
MKSATTKVVWAIVIALFIWVVWSVFMPRSYFGVILGLIACLVLLLLSVYDFCKERNFRTIVELICSTFLVLQAMKDVRQLSADTESAQQMSNALGRVSNRVEAVISQNDAREIEQLGTGIRLLQFSNTIVTIIHGTGNDSANFAQKLGQVLQLSRWSVDVKSSDKQISDGVMIGPCWSNQPTNLASWHPSRELWEAYNSLALELDTNHVDATIDTTIGTRTTLKFDGVLVIVGAKPTLDEAEEFRLERRQSALDLSLEERKTIFARLKELQSKKITGTGFRPMGSNGPTIFMQDNTFNEKLP